MTDNKLTDEQIIKAVDILEKMDFFGGQRAGRELWFDKPADVQNEDIKKFSNDVAFLKEFINRQKAEIERLQKENKTIRYCYQQAKSYNNSLAESCEKNCKKFNMITRAEARKEFAKELKKKATYYRCRDGIKYAVSISDIDNLLKEMEGE